MVDFELLRRDKRRQKVLRTFFELDVVPYVPDFNTEGLADCFDVDNCSYPSRVIKSTWGDDYDIALYGRLGLHCYNFQKGTNFKFVRWEKYDVKSTADVHFYVTLDAKDPASDSVFSFQTLLCEDSSPHCLVMWSTLVCRIKCDDAVDKDWDDKAVDDFYKGAMPKWLSDEVLASDDKKNYVVQESELQENEWLHLFTEIAFYSKTKKLSTPPPPLEIVKVVVVTNTEDGHEKLKAQNAIFYVSYKYNGESSKWARDHKAVIRKTMDGKPGHIYLEVVAVD